MGFKLPGGFGDLDFTDWVRGLIAGIIQGGASAVISSIVVSVKDPEHYAIGTANFFELAGSVFLMSGFLGGMSYLAKSPIPPVKTVTTTTTTVGKFDQPPTTLVTKTEETHNEPIEEKPKV